jgi:hypothetical protein
MAWFVAADVADALEYATAKDLARNLDADEKGRHIVPTPGGDQEMTVINESGLYHAVLKSRKPAAKAFRRWVTAEVLPAIRKTGRYELPPGRTPEQQCEIQTIVARLAHRPGNSYANLYRGLKDYFKVGTYKDIPSDKFDLAKCFLLGVESKEGDWEPAKPGGKYHFPLDTAKPRTMTLPQQAWLTQDALLDEGYNRPLQKLLNELRSDGCDVAGAAQEYKALYMLLESRSHLLCQLRDMAENGFLRGLNTWFGPKH